MSTVYPGALDSFTTKVDNVDSVMAAHINNVQDSVVALETLVGVTSSSVNTTVQYQLVNLPGQSSTTLVTNLNAHYLNGNASTYYTNVSNMLSGTLAIARGGTGLGSISAANRVLLSTDGSTFTTGQVDLATSQIKGNLPVGNLNGGTNADSSHFWRGDGTWAAIVSSNTQVFTSSGTFVAPSGVTEVVLYMQAGGGAGGAAGNGDNGGHNGGPGGGGAAGARLVGYPYTVVSGNSYTVTIGNGGTAPGGNGGDTVFDALTCPGGPGGTAGGNYPSNTAGTGGTSPAALSMNASTTTGGSKSIYVASGNGANGTASGGNGGGGGGTPWGAGGNGGTSANGQSAAVANSGAGGGGAGNDTSNPNTRTSGNGAAGFVVVQW